MHSGESQNVAPKDSLDTWFVTVYDQLRAFARQRLSGERSDHTLQPTALVNEVFLRLQNDRSLDQTDQSKFFLAAAEAMRRILIEHARRAAKSAAAMIWVASPRADQPRRGRMGHRAEPGPNPDTGRSDLSHDQKLAGKSAGRAPALLRRPERLETAKVMNVSEATVMRLWRYARAWLWRELNAGQPES